MLLALTAIIACSLAARGFQLRPRVSDQTQASVCSSEFSWADNSKGQSPCQVAANVGALCNGDRWTVPALPRASYYDPLIDDVASLCTCSWACYNLVSACAACQGHLNKTARHECWSAYSVNCTGKLSDTYFPPSLTLPQGTLIPFWATINPTSWPNELFDSATAKSINQGHTNTGSPRKSTSIVTIVGGVIGGVVVLLIAMLVAIYLIRQVSQPSPLLMANHTHLKSHSDVTKGV